MSGLVRHLLGMTEAHENPALVLTALLLIAIGLLPSRGRRLAQTGAGSLTGIVSDQSGAASARRDGHRDQPGHERRLHRRLERGRQLHRDVAAGRHLRREGGAVRLQDGRHEADRGGGEADRAARLQAGARRDRGDRSTSSASRRSCRPNRRPSARSSPARPLERAAAERPQHRPALTAAAGRGDAEPELVHRRSATSAAAGPTSTATASRPTTTRSTAST